MNIRFARENELNRINEIRKQVNDLHVAGKPDVFKPEFSKEMENFLYKIWEDPEQDIIIAEQDDMIIGYAVLHHLIKPENPAKLEQDYLDIDEFGVDESYRRQGAGTALMAFIRNYAKEKGFSRIELNMWEFNQSALAFYEAVGFTTFRRYMELFL